MIIIQLGGILKKIGIIIVILFLAYNLTYSQIDNEYKVNIKKMLELSGFQESYKTMIKQMVELFKTKTTEIPEGFWKTTEEEFLKTSLDEIVEMVTPIYAKYLTLEDVKKIAEFFQTAAGKKLAEKTPIITSEIMQVGQKWAMGINQKIIEKLKEKGYINN